MIVAAPDSGGETTEVAVRTWLRANFTSGIEQHDLSLDWLFDAVKDVGGRIEISHSYHRRGDTSSFEILLRGAQSGIMYRVSVAYSPKMASLLTRRLDEVDLAQVGTMRRLMHPFRKLLSFDVYWLDPRDGEWESICIETEEPESTWPADQVASVVRALGDDLNAALRRDMHTLRPELRQALITSWCEDQTSLELDWDGISVYLIAYEAYAKASKMGASWEDALEVENEIGCLMSGVPAMTPSEFEEAIDDFLERRWGCQ